MIQEKIKTRAPRNRTITLSDHDRSRLSARVLKLSDSVSIEVARNRIIHQDMLQATAHLPKASVDLLFLDPPYNLTKSFNGLTFKKQSTDDYSTWLDQWLQNLIPLLKPTATIYICGDWVSSASIFLVASKYFQIRNRISWEREKGRGAKTNWKNCSEDIWFCTMSDDYTFNVDSVKLRRRVIAPYRVDGAPKDWNEGPDGNYRLTFPSNLWTDITIPFWSMPENTDHPTQKPEKLVAKLMLASSRAGDLVLDPFSGSGTTPTVCRKLGRDFIGIEMDEEYCLLTLKRLETAEHDKTIQGYSNGYFWERNTLQEQQREQPATKNGAKNGTPSEDALALFSNLK